MALVAVLTHTLGKSPAGNSFIAIRVYCLLSCHSSPFCRVLLCILSSSPLGIQTQQLDPPLSFLLFKLNKLSFLHLSSYAICTSSLTILVEELSVSDIGLSGAEDTPNSHQVIFSHNTTFPKSSKLYFLPNTIKFEK